MSRLTILFLKGKQPPIRGDIDQETTKHTSMSNQDYVSNPEKVSKALPEQIDALAHLTRIESC